jgi:hypothetical protein
LRVLEFKVLGIYFEVTGVSRELHNKEFHNLYSRKILLR